MMDAQTRLRYLQAMGLIDAPGGVVRHQPGRHPQKTHGGGGGLVANALDKLKLAGRIDLDDGEELVSSGKLDADNGVVRVAVTRRDGRPSLRIAADSTDEDMPKWSGNRPHTAALQVERQRIEAERDQLDEDDPRYEELTDQLNELGAGDWNTARLDDAGFEDLRTRLRTAFAGASEAEKAEKKRWDEIGRLERERDKLLVDRKWTDEEEARWDALTGQIEVLKTPPDVEFDEQGVVSGDWGDVHFQVYFEEVDTGVRALVGVKPHGVEPDWEFSRDWKGFFDAAELRKILKLLDAGAV